MPITPAHTSRWRLFRRTFPHPGMFAYYTELRSQLGDCRSCLDVGCGPASPLRLLSFEHCVGVDGHAESIEAAERMKTHHAFTLARVQEIDQHFTEGQFDCCVALDLIEHLTKEDGLKLLQDMERIASRKVLLFTPNGFLPQEGSSEDLQEHLSGWDAEELRRLGYSVYGMLGPKWLRGEKHEHRFRPRALSGSVAAVTHYLFTRNNPQKAAALLCVKEFRSR